MLTLDAVPLSTPYAIQEDYTGQYIVYCRLWFRCEE